MRNKGFFWFFTILLTAVCLYQLSFTWVSNSVESKAAKTAKQRISELKKEAEANGTNKVFLDNGDEINFSNPEAEDIALAALTNEILRNKAKKEVYPVLGTSFKDVKNRSLAFGLDLVGGMSVTLEISVPDLVKNYARNEKSAEFKQVFNAAQAEYNQNGGDFIGIFISQFKANGKGKLVKLFNFSDIDELGIDSSDEDVEKFLRQKEKDSMVGVEEVMSRRINQFGVAQPNIQKDQNNNRLYIELPGVLDDASVSEKLVSTANLEFYEVAMVNEIGQFWEAANVASLADTQEEKEEVADSTTVQDSTSIDDLDLDLDLENLDEETEGGLSSYVTNLGNGFFVKSDDRGKIEELLSQEEVKAEFPEFIELMWGAEMTEVNKENGYVLYFIRIPEDGKPMVDGSDIDKAKGDINPENGEAIVSLTMTSDGTDKWGQMTEKNVGRPVAITMDNVVYSAPNVITAIKQGNTQISGNYTTASAKQFASLLNGGALPAPCLIKELNKVGPTLGTENRSASIISFGIALLLVFVYMIFYYGKAGIVADIALLANIIFIFGSLASFGAVLTLAGMAGIVLTIGMAVDANVLIFERIREEQANGKDLKSAINTGFQKALSSIIDANVTTMLTAIVLKVFGSGPIESFATTLIIGIFTSVFSALVVTRLIITWWMEKGKEMTFSTPTTKGAFKNLNINFVGSRKKYYIISGILVVLGIVSLASRGLNPSVEFTGGRTFGVKFTESVSDKKEAIESALKKVFVENGKEASVATKTKGSTYHLEISTNYMLSSEDGNKAVEKKMAEALAPLKDQIGTYKIEESRSVSPTVSQELISSSMIAIGLSLLIIFAYILMRFGRWQYSIGAIVAMVHDVIVVLAAFALLHGILPFNMEVDQAFIAAILTVIGYSINDTVVVFDRIRENLANFRGSNEKENINGSLNSTLSRTVNTSMTTFLVLLIIFFFGGAAIKGFVFALMIGVIVGTYSSLCIATPFLIDLSKKVKIAEKKEKE